MEPKVGVVVSNYMNYIDTIECIDSIAILDYKNTEIVVVENGSSNESFEKIYNHCKGKRNVRIIKVKRNLGFARGCNVG
jgi:GT2 family glycosyltransferase